MSASGKVNRNALPWPAPPQRAAQKNGAEPGQLRPSDGGPAELTGTAAWLADLWVQQLGPLAMTTESNVSELGGSSLAAAKLVSALRSRYPPVAVADRRVSPVGRARGPA